MMECYLGLGANQQDPVRVLNQANDQLRKLSNTQYLKASEIIITAPFGITGQPIFYNQVVQIYTEITPLDLLNKIIAIEKNLGKIKTNAWGPRKVDIDILIYGNISLRTVQLTLPHPQIWQRCFVKKSLLEFNSPLVNSYYTNSFDTQALFNNKKPCTLPSNLNYLFDSRQLLTV